MGIDATPQGFEQLMATAQRAALAGGAELVAWKDKFDAYSKGPADFVTDADLASQASVKKLIEQLHPEHLFIGEESEEERPQPTDEQFCWVVDPLDGTTNYLHQFPFYGVSIAVVLAGRVVAGAIYDPVREEMFHAAEGAGAFLNGTPLKTSAAEHLSDALLAMSLPANAAADSPDLLDFIQLVEHCQAIRRTGSSALNLAYVASGRLDAFWAKQIHPWDVAAGALLVSEAGGTISSCAGHDFNVWDADIVSAGRPQLHAELLERVRC